MNTLPEKFLAAWCGVSQLAGVSLQGIFVSREARATSIPFSGL